MQIVANGYKLCHTVGRLTKTAEDRFFKTGQITASVQCGNDFLRRRFTFRKPKIMPVVAGAFVANAEITAVRTLVGKVDVQIPVQRIKIGVLAVFFLIILVVLLVLFLLLILLILLGLLILLFLRLRVGFIVFVFILRLRRLINLRLFRRLRSLLVLLVLLLALLLLWLLYYQIHHHSFHHH